MPELLVRPSLNDHREIADLLAPTGFSGRRPIDRIVLSAQDAARRPQFSELAAASGTPLVVDPLTFLLRAEVDPGDAWVKEVSFGRADALSGDHLTNAFVLDSLV